MGVNDFWMILLAASAPVAGVVGFAIQLRNVKKLRLENEKLNLEIDQLQKAAAKADRRIVEPTNDEVIKYTDTPMFSRGYRVMEKEASIFRSKNISLNDVAILIVILFFIAYLVYDLYRLVKWLLALSF